MECKQYAMLLCDTREHRCDAFRQAVAGCPMEVVPCTLIGCDYAINRYDNGRWRYPGTRWGQHGVTVTPRTGVERKWPLELVQCLLPAPDDQDVTRHVRFLENLAKIKERKAHIIIAVDGSAADLMTAAEDCPGGWPHVRRQIDMIRTRYGVRTMCLAEVTGNGNLDKIVNILLKMERKVE